MNKGQIKFKPKLEPINMQLLNNLQIITNIRENDHILEGDSFLDQKNKLEVDI